MSHKRTGKVTITVLSWENVSTQDFLEVLLDMEMRFNERASRFRVHVTAPETTTTKGESYGNVQVKHPHG